MADDADTFERISNPAEVRKAHRRGNAEQARFNLLIAATALDAAKRLEAADHDRPAEVAQLVAQATDAHAAALKHSTAAAELAGIAEDAYPWQAWAEEVKNRQRGAEETFLVHRDRAEHPDAYNTDGAASEFYALQAQCDAAAWAATVADAEAKVPAPNRAARRAAGQRGKAGEE